MSNIYVIHLLVCSDVVNAGDARLQPTDDTAADVAEGMATFTRIRDRARRETADVRRRRRDKRRDWEADCAANERGTTQRLLRKPAPQLVAILQRADGTVCTGDTLADCAREQAGSRREDAGLRRETMDFLSNFRTDDRCGPPLTSAEAEVLVRGLRPSAPGLDQI
eukprot:gene1459-6329_t